MRLNDIKTILDSHFDDLTKEYAILQIIAEDRNVFNTLFKLLQIEREKHDELIIDTNAELSRAAAALNNPKLVEHSWVVEQIKLHYEKWKDVIKCNFNL